MHPESRPPYPNANRDLPPVTPPSGKELTRLILVPLAIVAGLVALGFALLHTSSWLVSGPASTEQALKGLDNTNPDVRWRAANDLAQVLLRDPKLAADPKLALDLAERLRRALDVAADAEEARRKHLRDRPEEYDPNLKALDAERSYVVYLSACLGNFSTPVGVPLLNRLALDETAADPEARVTRQRQAVWSLANLGERLRKRFDDLGEDEQNAVLEALDREALAASGDRGQWAKLAHDHLRSRQEKRPTSMGVDETLAETARANDPFLRKLTALALGFWDGPRADDTLLRLVADDGRGPEPERAIQEARDVRVNALVSLARRGSPKFAPWLKTFAELLDEPKQQENFRSPQGVVDVVSARNTVLNALRAARDLHTKRRDLDLTPLRDAVEKLRQSADGAVRFEAEETRKVLNP